MDFSSYDTRGRVITQAFFTELEKIASATVPQDQGVGDGADAGLLQGGVQNEASPQGEVWENEALPAHGVVASRVQQLDPRRAVAIPVMQPPPGYVYDPQLASFVPNQQDPGWLAQSQVLEAARNKGWYEQGQQDVVAGQAQQQLDADAEAGVQQALAEDQQMAEDQQVQQAAQDQAMMSAAKKEVSGQGAPGAVPKPKSKPKADVSAKGVSINIGK